MNYSQVLAKCINKLTNSHDKQKTPVAQQTWCKTPANMA